MLLWVLSLWQQHFSTRESVFARSVMLVLEFSNTLVVNNCGIVGFLTTSVRTALQCCSALLFSVALMSITFVTFQFSFLQTFVNWKEARLTWSFFKQSFLKQILTEGEALHRSVKEEGS